MFESLTRVQSANEGRNSIYGFGEQNGTGWESERVGSGEEESSETHSRGHILSIPLRSALLCSALIGPFHFPPVP